MTIITIFDEKGCCRKWPDQPHWTAKRPDWKITEAYQKSQPSSYPNTRPNLPRIKKDIENLSHHLYAFSKEGRESKSTGGLRDDNKLELGFDATNRLVLPTVQI